jgi:hypothetical protein
MYREDAIDKRAEVGVLAAHDQRILMGREGQSRYQVGLTPTTLSTVEHYVRRTKVRVRLWAHVGHPRHIAHGRGDLSLDFCPLLGIH